MGDKEVDEQELEEKDDVLKKCKDYYEDLIKKEKEKKEKTIVLKDKSIAEAKKKLEDEKYKKMKEVNKHDWILKKLDLDKIAAPIPEDATRLKIGGKTKQVIKSDITKEETKRKETVDKWETKIKAKKDLVKEKEEIKKTAVEAHEEKIAK